MIIRRVNLRSIANAVIGFAALLVCGMASAPVAKASTDMSLEESPLLVIEMNTALAPVPGG